MVMADVPRSCPKRRPHVALEWDNALSMVVARRGQVGLSRRHSSSTFPHSSSYQLRVGLADVIAVPEEILELRNLNDVLSGETWRSLSESEREMLSKYLPSGIDHDLAVHSLLEGDNIDFGNPLSSWGFMVCRAAMHPDALLLRDQEYKYRWKEYCKGLRSYHGNLVSKLQMMQEIWKTCQNQEQNLLPLLERQELKFKPDISQQKYQGESESESDWIDKYVDVISKHDSDNGCADIFRTIKVNKKMFRGLVLDKKTGAELHIRSLRKILDNSSSLEGVVDEQGFDCFKDKQLRDNWQVLAHREVPAMHTEYVTRTEEQLKLAKLLALRCMNGLSKLHNTQELAVGKDRDTIEIALEADYNIGSLHEENPKVEYLPKKEEEDSKVEYLPNEVEEDPKVEYLPKEEADDRESFTRDEVELETSPVERAGTLAFTTEQDKGDSHKEEVDGSGSRLSWNQVHKNTSFADLLKEQRKRLHDSQLLLRNELNQHSIQDEATNSSRHRIIESAQRFHDVIMHRTEHVYEHEPGLLLRELGLQSSQEQFRQSFSDSNIQELQLLPSNKSTQNISNQHYELLGCSGQDMERLYTDTQLSHQFQSPSTAMMTFSQRQHQQQNCHSGLVHNPQYPHLSVSSSSISLSSGVPAESIWPTATNHVRPFAGGPFFVENNGPWRLVENAPVAWALSEGLQNSSGRAHHQIPPIDILPRWDLPVQHVQIPVNGSRRPDLHQHPSFPDHTGQQDLPILNEHGAYRAPGWYTTNALDNTRPLAQHPNFHQHPSWPLEGGPPKSMPQLWGGLEWRPG